MKYNKILIKRAFEFKEKQNEETKEIIEKLIEAYNLCYGELRDSNTDRYELRERLKRNQKENKTIHQKRKTKEKEPKIETKTTFLEVTNEQNI